MHTKMTQSGVAVHVRSSTDRSGKVEGMQPSLEFPDQIDLTPEIPPTWAASSEVFHITERCGRLRAIPSSKRVTGKPDSKLRQCFNCVDIIRTKRRG
jgi:hypothetical protein